MSLGSFDWLQALALIGALASIISFVQWLIPSKDGRLIQMLSAKVDELSASISTVSNQIRRSEDKKTDYHFDEEILKTARSSVKECDKLIGEKIFLNTLLKRCFLSFL
ncbi:MAG: hypothetical protein AAFY12_17055 [Pseudomonadota bacterium]